MMNHLNSISTNQQEQTTVHIIKRKFSNISTLNDDDDDANDEMTKKKATAEEGVSNDDKWAVYEDELFDGDKENRNPNKDLKSVPAGAQQQQKPSASARKEEEEEEEDDNIFTARNQLEKVHLRLIENSEKGAFVAKLYSSLPQTKRVILSDITRQHSPNRLPTGITKISNGKFVNDDEDTTKEATKTKRSLQQRSVLKVR
jgi:hypothetical protein